MNSLLLRQEHTDCILEMFWFWYFLHLWL